MRHHAFVSAASIGSSSGVGDSRSRQYPLSPVSDGSVVSSVSRLVTPCAVTTPSSAEDSFSPASGPSICKVPLKPRGVLPNTALNSSGLVVLFESVLPMFVPAVSVAAV